MTFLMPAFKCLVQVAHLRDSFTSFTSFYTANILQSFILRMQRHTDNAEIEVIVSPTSRIGEYNLYFRLDTKTYSDESVIRSITEALANDFKEAGLKIDVNPHCCAERLEPFNIARPTISDAARHLHNIPEPQQHAKI